MREEEHSVTTIAPPPRRDFEEVASDRRAPWGAPVRSAVLDNGLRVVVSYDVSKPLVSTALWYDVGTRDERPDQSGLAHFLEHMMFKGSARFGAGEVDRLTQSLGGSNNAFTSHDATVYTFNLPGDAWQAALEIEADRMTALTLDAAEVGSERNVVLEEIAMYESDPWDALDQAVTRALFAGHPYGEPVLGHPERMRAHTRESLAEFHRDHYRVDNAVLAVAGRAPFDEVVRCCEQSFPNCAESSPQAPARRRGAVPGLASADGVQRIERHMGETPRLLYTVPAPPASDPAHPLWRLLMGCLAAGRGSRLHRVLVEERRCATWVNADVSESVGPCVGVFTLEVPPEVPAQRAEEALLGELERLLREPITAQEVQRVQTMLKADFVFSHERTSRQVVALGAEELLYGVGFYRRALESVLEAEADELQSIAQQVQLGAGGVLGWSLPGSGQ